MNLIVSSCSYDRNILLFRHTSKRITFFKIQCIQRKKAGILVIHSNLLLTATVSFYFNYLEFSGCALKKRNLIIFPWLTRTAWVCSVLVIVIRAINSYWSNIWPPGIQISFKRAYFIVNVEALRHDIQIKGNLTIIV